MISRRTQPATVDREAVQQRCALGQLTECAQKIPSEQGFSEEVSPAASDFPSQSAAPSPDNFLGGSRSRLGRGELAWAEEGMAPFLKRLLGEIQLTGTLQKGSEARPQFKQALSEAYDK